METLTTTPAQEVVNHHVSAFLEANLDDILSDFTEDSELLTPDGALKGLNAIRSFFFGIFNIIPKGSEFKLKQSIVRDDLVYLVWSCESPFVNIPTGTDTFIIENDKIRYQTLAAHIVPK